MSFVTPGSEQAQAAAPASSLGGGGGGEAHAEAGGRRVLPQLQTTQTTRQLPGEKGFLKKEPPHTRVTQSVREYVQGDARTPPSSTRQAEYSVHELAASEMCYCCCFFSLREVFFQHRNNE